MVQTTIDNFCRLKIYWDKCKGNLFFSRVCFSNNQWLLYTNQKPFLELSPMKAYKQRSDKASMTMTIYLLQKFLPKHLHGWRFGIAFNVTMIIEHDMRSSLFHANRFNIEQLKFSDCEGAIILTLSNINRFATRLTVLASTASILANSSAYGILRPYVSSCKNKEIKFSGMENRGLGTPFSLLSWMVCL